MNDILSTSYISLSNSLFKPEVCCYGTSEVVTNFNEMKCFDWSKLTLNLIRKYNVIYQQLSNNINKLPNYISNIYISSIINNIQLYLPENYNFIKKAIILEWIVNYRNQLNRIYIQDIFDTSWYDSHSSDYKWAETRIINLENINKEIDEYSTE